MIGVMPIVAQFAASNCPTAVRYQVALFVEELCCVSSDSSSVVSIQMFLACRGIQVRCIRCRSCNSGTVMMWLV